MIESYLVDKSIYGGWVSSDIIDSMQGLKLNANQTVGYRVGSSYQHPSNGSGSSAYDALPPYSSLNPSPYPGGAQQPIGRFGDHDSPSLVGRQGLVNGHQAQGDGAWFDSDV